MILRKEKYVTQQASEKNGNFELLTCYLLKVPANIGTNLMYNN